VASAARSSPSRRPTDRLDDLDQLVDAIPLPAREADEVAGSSDDRASLGRSGDVDAAAAPELEQAFVAQVAECAEHGVRVHTEDGRKIACRRQTFARRRLAVGDRPSNFGGNLPVKLRRVAAVDLDADHGASNTSSIVASVLVPPTEPQGELDPPLEPDALIEEARERQRRRRLRVALLVGIVGAIGFGVYALLARGDATTVGATTSRNPSTAGYRCPPGDLGTVAFLRGGALDVVDLNGCKTRVLVRSHASGPVQFSFDGLYVAFNGGFVATQGGAVVRTQGAGTWSPTRDLLADGTKRGGLVLVRPNGPIRRLLPDGWGVLTFAFSRDGRTLAVSRSHYSSPAVPASTWHQEIWLVNVATGRKRLIFKLNPPALAPAWLQGFSPDDRWLLFWEDSQNSASLAADGLPLVALPLAGGKPVHIANELDHQDFLAWCNGALVYVIDRGGREVTLGDGIAVARPPLWHSQTVLPMDGKTSWNAIACPTAAAAARGGGGLIVAGGPTNDDSPFGHERRSLWMAPAGPRAVPRRLTQTDPPAGQTDELPMWSGDGRWILFVRTKPGGIAATGALYALDPFGGNLVGPIATIGRASNYYGSYSWPLQLDWHR